MNIYKLLTTEDAAQVLATVSEMKWAGKARTKELTGTIKQNYEILSNDNKVATRLLAMITSRIMQHSSVALECVTYKVHTPKFNKYSNGGQYFPHTDAPWMAETRTDISCTLWLSEPDSYKGGELVIEGKSFKGNPGEALFYNCGSVHHVTPVTEGERICAVTWVQSRIRDPIKRKMITDFRKWLSKMEGTELFPEGSIIYSALLKRWME